MNHYQMCPICNGRGIVAKGFYEKLGRLSKKHTEPCRLCLATGAILIFDIVWQTTITQPTWIPNPGVGTIPFDESSPFPGTTWIGGSCDSSITIEGRNDYINKN